MAQKKTSTCAIAIYAQLTNRVNDIWDTRAAILKNNRRVNDFRKGGEPRKENYPGGVFESGGRTHAPQTNWNLIRAQGRKARALARRRRHRTVFNKIGKRTLKSRDTALQTRKNLNLLGKKRSGSSQDRHKGEKKLLHDNGKKNQKA